MKKVVFFLFLAALIVPVVPLAQANKTVQEFVMDDGKTLRFESTEGVTITREEAIKFYEAQRKFDEYKEWERQHPTKGNSQTASDTPQQRPKVNYITNSERAELARLQAHETAKNRAMASVYGRNNTTTTFSPPPPIAPVPNYSYRGTSGAEYQYDLSKQDDRMRYRYDIPAQIRDNVYDPRRSMDRISGARGGGINP